jgi:tRNA A-37 threonylcarbamoyl transferase component Bud32
VIVTAGHLVGGRYRLIQPIGQGGMAMVWHGQDEMLGREVAIKQILMSPGTPDSERRTLIDRVLREARNAARLSDHPNIVAVHDVVLEDGVPWTIMQLVAGHSLQQHLDAWGPLPAEHVVEIAAAMLRALGAAHAAGIVHRDVKPGNVMLADNGEILLTDFGIAIHYADVGLTMTGMFVGSPGYVAPERLRGGDGDSSSDLYSLGVTLYWAVEGVAPFPEGNPLAVLDDPVPVPQRAGRLAPLIMALLEKEPTRRPGVPEALAMISAPAPEMPTAPMMPPAGAEADGTVPFNAVPFNAGPMGGGPVNAGLAGGTAVMPMQGEQNPTMFWQAPGDPGAPTATGVPGGPGMPGGPGFPPYPPNRRKNGLSNIPVAVPIIGTVILIVIAVVALVLYNGNQNGNASASATNTPSASTGTSAPAGVILSGSASPSASPSPSAQAMTGTITGYQGLCLDDSGGSTANSNPVIVYNCNNGTNQQWTVQTNGTVQTLGMCLDVGGGATNDGATVDLYTCNNTGAQVWQPQSNGELVNPQSGKCLDDTNFGGSGIQVQIWDCGDGSNQQWKLPTTAAQSATGTVTGYQGLCLDDSGGSTSNSNPVIVYTCNNGTNQQWTVGTNGTLQTLGMCLDVGGGATNDGATVDLYTCNNTGAQVWQPQSNGELVNPQSGKCLDDTNFGGSGTQVQIWDCGDGANQQWKLP